MSARMKRWIDRELVRGVVGVDLAREASMDAPSARELSHANPALATWIKAEAQERADLEKSMRELQETLKYREQRIRDMQEIIKSLERRNDEAALVVRRYAERITELEDSLRRAAQDPSVPTAVPRPVPYVEPLGRPRVVKLR